LLIDNYNTFNYCNNVTLINWGNSGDNKMKVITIISISLMIILVLGLILYFDYKEENKMEEEPRLFQGPVPEGYDEEHFRKTGETKLLEVEE